MELTPLHEKMQNIRLGNGIAEQDELLQSCMIKTQHFSDLFRDRIDLVLGSKGAGKSSLFRIFGEVLEGLLFDKSKTIVVSGVETKGDPVFLAYANHFQNFTESQFEAFWRAYLLGLAYNKIIHDEKSAPAFNNCPEERAEFVKLYKGLGLLDVGKIASPIKILKLVCAYSVALVEGIRAEYNIEKGQITLGASIREKASAGYDDVATPKIANLDTVLCIDALFTLVKVSGYKVWILLDHLDIVFKRRSYEETRALRALLRVLYAFTSDHVRLKIFLRDDILEAISSDSQEPLAGLSHITARSGQNLKWTSDSLCVMIMKRLASNKWLTEKYLIENNRLEDVEYSRAMFQTIFGIKYVTQQAFDWIYSLLSDGRGVVTPRDLIDLLGRAFYLQSLWLQKHPEKSDFMTIGSVQEAHKELSKSRRETVLKTEFSHLMNQIRKLERGKDRYEKDELLGLFPENPTKAVADLIALGIVYFDHKKSCYRIAKLYGAGLEVYATRPKKNGK